MKQKIILSVISLFLAYIHLHVFLLVWLQLDHFRELTFSYDENPFEFYINYELAYRYIDLNFLVLCFLVFIKISILRLKSKNRTVKWVSDILCFVVFFVYLFIFFNLFYERVYGYYSLPLDWSTYSEIINNILTYSIVSNLLLLIFTSSLLVRIFNISNQLLPSLQKPD